MGPWGFEGKIGEPEITRLGCVCWLLAQHLSRQKSELTITLGDAYIFCLGPTSWSWTKKETLNPKDCELIPGSRVLVRYLRMKPLVQKFGAFHSQKTSRFWIWNQFICS